MNDDDLITDIMPNDGASFHQNDDDDRTDAERAQDKAEQDERSMMRSAGNKLTDQLITWIESEIAATDSVKAVKAYADSIGKDEAVVLEAFEVVRNLLEGKRDELIALKEEHLS